jgi:peptide/nickel transport system permease protein
MTAMSIPFLLRRVCGLGHAPALERGCESQRKLIWLKFRGHRTAYWSLWLLTVLYAIALCAGFFATNDPVQRRVDRRFLPPGGLDWRITGPFVRARTSSLNIESLDRVIRDTGGTARLKLFAAGDPYLLFGLIPARRHLLGTGDSYAAFFPLGTDGSGRCVWSRLVYGMQVSLSISLVSILLTMVLGIVIGGISGYFGGIVDSAVQRFTEVIMSFPSLPLWMALSAALPLSWSVFKVFFAISVILSLVGWTGLARVVRSKFLALREEEFVLAARLDGAGSGRLIFRHMLPLFSSHLIVAATVALPGMILGETALSFLGIGLRAPAISLGVLLQEAQNVESVALRPWLLAPAAAVILVVVAFSCVGDGLRDAADPYH